MKIAASYDELEGYYNLLERAIKLLDGQEYQKALKLFEKTFQIKLDDEFAWLGHGRALMALGRNEEALLSFEKAIEIQPNLFDAHCNRGFILANQRKEDEALLSFEKAIENQPDCYQAWYDCGIILRNQGKEDEALLSFEKAAEIQPDCYQAWYNCGVLLSEKEKEKALFSYRKTVEIQPDFYHAWTGISVVLRELGRYEEALLSCERAIGIQTDDYRAWHNRGNILKELGRYKEALFSFQKTIEIQPDCHQSWYGLGKVYDELGRKEEAISSYKKTIEIHPSDYQAWYSLGVLLRELGRDAEALSSFESSIKIRPDYSQALVGYGLLLNKRGEKGEALSCYEKAIEIKNDDHFAWYNRGNTLYELGRYKEALFSHEKAIENQRDFHEAWGSRGSVLKELGRYAEALSSYEKVIEIYPDDYLAWTNCGIVLNDLERKEEALSSFERAIEIKPDFYLVLDACGSLLRGLGRYEEALLLFERAIEIKPYYYQAWYNRGYLMMNLGRYKEALLSFERAVKNKPDFYQAWIGSGKVLGQSIILDTFLDSIEEQNQISNRSIYEGELAKYEEGLKYCPKDTHPEGWGILQQAIGDYHYLKGIVKGIIAPQPRHYWDKAITSYNKALSTLTANQFPEFHLEVLNDLIRVYLLLGETEKAKELQRKGTEVLKRLLRECLSPERKKQLVFRFANFQQLTVDTLAQSGKLIEAISLAEKGKNACLSWILYGFGEEKFLPAWSEIQQQLLTPKTAIIYWHLSSASLHSFILKYQAKSPIFVTNSISTEEEFPEAFCNLNYFEDWVEKWNQQYEEYASKKKETNSQHPWQAEMEQQFDSLRDILNIQKIEEHLTGIEQLILIPHRDLHRFPLHALFSEQFDITYLPSIQIGLSLKEFENDESVKPNLLSAEVSESAGLSSLDFAVTESGIICKLFTEKRQINEEEASKEQVATALTNSHNIFHFAGHGLYNFDDPKSSELALADNDRLTIKDILQLDLSHYQLVSLSACETAITGNQTITTEYVGLVSAFLSRGVSSVVSTLWTVESATTAVVMIEFYRRWMSGTPKVKALRETTYWLRNLTFGDLRQWYENLLSTLTPDEMDIELFIETEIDKIDEKLHTMGLDQKPYQHPYYWAAFMIAGNISNL